MVNHILIVQNKSKAFSSLGRVNCIGAKPCYWIMGAFLNFRISIHKVGIFARTTEALRWNM